MSYSDKYLKVMQFVLAHEGGYCNLAGDPGGETKYGISKRSYPDLDIPNLTEQDALDIYWRDFWDKTGCEELDYPMALAIMDTAVNLGINKANALKTTSAGDWKDYLIQRIAHYNKINNKEFIHGWLNRVIDLWSEIKLNGDGL